MGNRVFTSRKNQYKDIKVNIPETMKIECRLYFQQKPTTTIGGRYSDNSSKIYFRTIPQGESYKLQEQEIVEVYVNDSLVFSGDYKSLDAFNTLIPVLPNIDYQRSSLKIFESNGSGNDSGNDSETPLLFTIKKSCCPVENSNSNSPVYFIFFGDVTGSLYFATTKLRSIKEIINLKSAFEITNPFTYEIVSNTGEITKIDILSAALDYFNIIDEELPPNNSNLKK